MEGISKLWYGSGLYNIEAGQVIMIAVCLLLLFLAIKKGFEPLLLLPIGFGGLMANIPEAGLAMSSVENLVHLGSPEQMAKLAAVLNMPFDVAAQITPEIRHELLVAFKGASAATYQAAMFVAQDSGYTSGMLYNFFSVAILSGVAPLLIFMGVGAMTDFGPLLANPKTLLLGRPLSSVSLEPFWAPV